VRDPDFTGRGGSAWRLPPHERWPTTLASFLLDVPGAHPHWHRWMLSVVHLRDAAGFPPATVTLAGAAHELVVGAIHPDWEPDGTVDDLGVSRGVPFLRPLDVIRQFIVRSDEDAARLAERCTRAVTDGVLSPDQDWRRIWAGFIDTTAARLCEGDELQ